MEGHDKFVKASVAKLMAGVKATMEEFKAKIQSLEEEVTLLKPAIIQTRSTVIEVASTKLLGLNFKPFSKVCIAKDLQNFLWVMKQYFIAVSIPQNEQVTITIKYLLRDAKL